MTELSKLHHVIFSYFQHDDDRPVHDSIKDLALVLVEEILNGDRSVPPLIDPFHKLAKEGDRAFLIHYGDGVEDKKTPPQQFSVSENKVFLSIENKHGNKMLVHTAHCRHGSSGAPLLVFNEESKKFVVAAVHYAGAERKDLAKVMDSKKLNSLYAQNQWLNTTKVIDSPGFALQYANSEWLQDTVRAGGRIEMIRERSQFMWQMGECDLKTKLQKDFMKELKDLDKYPKNHSLRLGITAKLPDGVKFSGDAGENIIFAK